MAYEACIAEIRRLAGGDLSESDVEKLLEDVAARAKSKLRADPALGPTEAFKRASGELAAEAKAAAAIQRRNAIENLKKRLGRRQFYTSAPEVGRTPGPLVGLEAKLVGVNTPFPGARLSVDAQAKALRRQFVEGMTAELDKAGLFQAARGEHYARDWARELAELNKGKGGRPGITRNETARRIAEIVHRFQNEAVDELNRAGAWIGQYDGYISRTSHDPDRIRRAGFTAWRDTLLKTLDTDKTFQDIETPEERERFLENVYHGLITGVHLTQDGLQGFKDPAFTGPGNMAKRLSQSRVLHFKDADAWLDYHAQFGGRSLIESVIQSLEHSANNAAVMREFGTSPRAELEADLRWLEETRRKDTPLMDALRKKRPLLDAYMAQLDGTSRMPVNRLAARRLAGWRAWLNLSKLGGVVLSSVTDVPTKAAELHYQGLNLLEAYGDGLVSLARGRGARGSVDRAVIDDLRAGLEGMRGHLASRFDGADTPPGILSKLANTYFRWNGLAYWTDAQRAGAELLMSRNLGRQSERGLDALEPEARRALEQFGISGREWDMIRGQVKEAEDGRRYVTPDLVNKIDRADIVDHLKATKQVPKDEARGVAPARIARYRADLAMRLYAYFADRGEYAVIQPGARERALLLRSTRPGTVEGEALRLIMQFKSFPAAVIMKGLGRELYGRDTTFGATAGLVHMLAASTVFGYMAMVAKDLVKGRTPRDPSKASTWAAAFTQGGGAGIYGDFIVGQWSRFGNSLLASLAGPSFSQIDDVADLWNRIKADAGGLKEPQDVFANAMRLALNDTPFINLFYTRIALDWLFLYQVQEALNPGFLRRYERTIQQQNNQSFLIRPSAAIPYGGGGRLLEGVRS